MSLVTYQSKLSVELVSGDQIHSLSNLCHSVNCQNHVVSQNTINVYFILALSKYFYDAQTKTCALFSTVILISQPACQQLLSSQNLLHFVPKNPLSFHFSNSIWNQSFETPCTLVYFGYETRYIIFCCSRIPLSKQTIMSGRSFQQIWVKVNFLCLC